MSSSKPAFPLWSLSDPGVEPYRLIQNADKNPNEMIPLLPGESIHIGYEPISEEDAFVSFNPEDYRIAFSVCKLYSFQIRRGFIPCDRLARLIHKFNCLNYGIQIIMPKRETFDSFVQTDIYRSNVDFKTFRGKRATMTVTIRAVVKPSEDLESGIADHFVEIEIFRNSGSVQVYQLYSTALEAYIRSNGTESAFISQTVENTTHWKMPLAHKTHKTIDDSDSESSLDGERGYVKPFCLALDNREALSVTLNCDGDSSPTPRRPLSVKMNRPTTLADKSSQISPS